jgi:hypothetical protein
MKAIFHLSISLFILSCDHPSPAEVSEGTFAIYTLQDTTITGYDAMSISIESLNLSDSPFLTVTDLKLYVWTKHHFEVTPQMQSRFKKLQSRYKGAGEERIYLGAFWWGYSALMTPPCAVIDILSLDPTYEIGLGRRNATDKRSDTRIYDSLKQAGILVK